MSQRRRSRRKIGGGRFGLVATVFWSLMVLGAWAGMHAVDAAVRSATDAIIARGG